VIIKQITLAQPPDAALDAVKRLLQAAMPDRGESASGTGISGN
jgi:hypothetical protein